MSFSLSSWKKRGARGSDNEQQRLSNDVPGVSASSFEPISSAGATIGYHSSGMPLKQSSSFWTSPLGRSARKEISQDRMDAVARFMEWQNEKIKDQHRHVQAMTKLCIEQRKSIKTGFKCMIGNCHQNVEDDEAFKQHFLKHHSGVKCPIEGCGASFVDNMLLTQHYQQHSQGLKCTAERCEAICLDEEQLTLHLLQCHQNDVKCTIEGCGALFIDEKQLMLHRPQRHQTANVGFMCMVVGCGASFVDERRLLLHQEQHQSRFKCHISDCGAHFFAEVHLLIHLKRQHQQD